MAKVVQGERVRKTITAKALANIVNQLTENVEGISKGKVIRLDLKSPPTQPSLYIFKIKEIIYFMQLFFKLTLNCSFCHVTFCR